MRATPAGLSIEGPAVDLPPVTCLLRWRLRGPVRTTIRGLSVFLVLSLGRILSAQTEATPALSGILANGYRFAYLDEGTGQPVVLVHDALADYRDWNGQLALRDRFRVLAYSRRYHYPNPYRPGDPPASVRGDAGDLIALIHAWGLERPVLAGYGTGATVALLAALRAPTLVGGLVLFEPLLDSLIADSTLRETSAESERRAWTAAAQAFQTRDPEPGFRVLLDALQGPGTWSGLPPGHRSRLLENATVLDATDPGQPALDCRGLAGLGLPVRVLEGAATDTRFRASNDGLLRCLADARRIVIPGAGHQALRIQPDRFTEALRAALAR